MIYAIAVEFAEAQAPERKVRAWLEANLDRLAEPLSGVFIGEGALAAEQIRNGLEPLLRPHDRLIIVKAATEAVWLGLEAAAARWMAESFPGSITERIPDPAEGTA